jgi:lysozyme
MTIRNVNVETENLIKRKEGLVLAPYLCPAKVWTVGYGTIVYPSWYMGGKRVGPSDPPISIQMALDFLRSDLDKFEAGVEGLLKRPANDNEFGAMVSLTYNIGLAGFASSSVLRLFNQGDKAGAMRSFALWNKADLNGDGKVDQSEVVPGLVVRRKEEQTLFATPVVTDISQLIPPPEPMPAVEMPPELPMPQLVLSDEKGPVKTAVQSTTLQTAAVAGGAGAIGTVATTVSILDTMNTATQVATAANTMATATAGTAQIAATAATGLHSIGNMQIIALVASGVALAAIIYFAVRYFNKKRSTQVF